jgi:hypothetical protein
MRIVVPISKLQARLLQPIFDDLKEKNFDGKPSVIAAQVFTDGIVVQVVSGRAAEQLCKVCGGDINRIRYYAEGGES